MRRFFGLGLAILLIFTMSCTVLADDFVPSITYKGAPEMVPTEEGNLGVVYQSEDGAVISDIEGECLLITPLAEVDDEHLIPEEGKELINWLYEQLLSGEMSLPVDQVPGAAGRKWVIRDLVDIRWLCGTEANEHDHPEEVEPEGIVFDVTLDLGVAPGVEVLVMTYKNDQWNPVEKVVNNGDGTVTVTFEHLCPVAFAVPEGTETPAPDTGDSGIMPWVMTLVAAAVALTAVVLVAFRRRTQK